MVWATRHAVELPLPEPVETLLRAMADQEHDVEDPAGLVLALRMRQYVTLREGSLAVTSIGRAYLAARTGFRVPSPVHVELVDATVNTARVVVMGWSTEHAVTVLLEQLTEATGLEPAELPGAVLAAVANVDAERAEDVVLTGIRTEPKTLPQTWKAAGAEASPEEEEGEERGE